MLSVAGLASRGGLGLSFDHGRLILLSQHGTDCFIGGDRCAATSRAYFRISRRQPVTAFYDGVSFSCF